MINMKRKDIKVVYKSLWETATPEQRREYQKRLDEVYDMLFREITEKYGKQLVNAKIKKKDV